MDQLKDRRASLLLLLLINPLLLLLLLVLNIGVLLHAAGDHCFFDDLDRRFRCCSFVTTAAISLSSIAATADVPAEDLSTNVVAAIGLEFRCD